MKRSKKLSIIISIITVLYFAIILFLCFSDFSKIVKLPRNTLNLRLDLIVHYLMFLAFPFVTWAFFQYTIALKQKYIYWVVMTAGVAFALLIEVVQSYFIPYRSGELSDFFADILGLISGIVILLSFDDKIIKWLSEKIMKN